MTITRAWASGFGAVSELVCPPWFTAVPRMIPWMGSPSATAQSSGLRKTAPAPSPLTYPSARLSNVLHLPDGLNIPALVKAMWSLGVRITLTPPAIAASHSPLRIDMTARWIATRELEHAVSTGSLGPRRSSRWDIRFASTEWAVPVGEWASAETPCRARSSA